ncbi:hypothetical protein MEX01_28980 [Methylorubrum extorquens]|uniref:hypothetical protein n=1 Tax=Methylorubrum extorquens TaxID=408 RepID=UPI001174BE47|nr:hypothetical protein [Methylorubrum extorquens]GEL42307.1 hypothetical protein MEX01_28980 [Methylorubrum extorquens]
MKRANSLEKAVRAHTNLSTFATLVSILEGGHLYGGNPRSDRAAQKIIDICKAEQQKLLRDYDTALAATLTSE